MRSDVAVLSSFLDQARDEGRVLRTDAELDQRLANGGSSRLVTVNLYDLHHYVHDAAYRRLIDAADHWTADGQPVVRALRRVGVAADRVTGSDLCTRLVTAPLPAGLRRVAVLGSSLEVLAAFEQHLTLQGRELVFADAGSRESWTAETVGEALRRARPDLLLIAVGTPYGASVAARLLPSVTCPVVPIGAGVGMAVQMERRAPLLLQRLHGEWAWRMITDPRRLVGRYARDCVPVLFALRQAARHVGGVERDAHL